jgi:hypothetical protein
MNWLNAIPLVLAIIGSLVGFFTAFLAYRSTLRAREALKELIDEASDDEVLIDTSNPSDGAESIQALEDADV